MPVPPAPLTGEQDLALRAWELMGGTLDWSGLELVVELLGVQDVDRLVRDLVVIRKHAQAGGGSGE